VCTGYSLIRIPVTTGYIQQDSHYTGRYRTTRYRLYVAFRLRFCMVLKRYRLTPPRGIVQILLPTLCYSPRLRLSRRIPSTSWRTVMSSLLQRMIMLASLPATHTQRPFSVVYLPGARRSSAVTNAMLSWSCSRLLIHLFTAFLQI
jgi:hypothetical protein